ncbi:Alpha/Beta hydrolase protein [Phyllosticta citrichinensis]|uniref:Alpha/Beta hydrolase protein n=1 Tax=Phyllosticta citrichinensis TaxID=1130410 RepID=A0ABR1XX42_9PEZI
MPLLARSTATQLRAVLSRASTTASGTARTFGTTRPLASLKLAYQLHEPPKAEPSGGELASEAAPILILHGLFGSKKNNKSISRQLARDLRRPIYALDARNHGDSPHDARHDYVAMAEDVEGFIDEHRLSGSTLIGHSMGAKTIMTVALRKPEIVRDLIPVDNAPVDAALKNDFAAYIKGMMAIDEAHIKRHKHAHEILEPYCPEQAVEWFLFTNMKRRAEDETLHFTIPLNYLAKALDALGDFPFKNPDEARYEGRTLMVRGTQSHYVPDETLPIAGRFFPLFKTADIDCGHWVISEKPEEFRQAVVEFLKEDE